MIKNKNNGDWGLGMIGDWGLGIGDWGLGPIPNPQSPIPNPQSPIPNPQSPIPNPQSPNPKHLFIKKNLSNFLLFSNIMLRIMYNNEKKLLINT